jgi:exodeoxyribonuclease III
MRLATWNVNSIRQRERHVARWLEKAQPDVLFLQEIKCETAAFPAANFEALGYACAAVGQKAYNGVAALSRLPFETVHTALPNLAGDVAAQARYIEIEAGGLVLIGIYLPNGNSGGEAGYRGKLDFMAALKARAETLLAEERDFAILGDWNVAPTDEDYAKGALSPDDALIRPETRTAYRSILWLGLTDAIRALHPSGPVYTYWDYQSASFQRDSGLRIDHALLSPRLAERLTAARPDRRERGEEQPSDHVPVVIDIA